MNFYNGLMIFIEFALKQIVCIQLGSPKIKSSGRHCYTLLNVDSLCPPTPH